MICEREYTWVVASKHSIHPEAAVASHSRKCNMNSILQVVNECDDSEIKLSYFIYDQNTGSAVKRSTENAP